MVQANLNRPLVPTFGVKLNGEPMTKGMEPWIAGIRVDDEINAPGVLELQLVARDPGDRAVQWMDDERLKLGARIEVSLGYGAQLDTVIIGEITDLEPVFTMDGPPQMVVHGQDRRHRLNGARKTQSWENIQDSHIARLIVDPLMSIDSTDSGVPHQYRSQENETDLAFLQRLATLIGYEMVMKGATLLFRPRAHNAPEVAKLTFEDDLFEFHPHMKLLPVTDVRMLGWNVQKKDKFDIPGADDQVGAMGTGKTLGTSQARIALGGVVDMLIREAVASQAELDQLAAARRNDIALDFISGEGRCRGRTDVRAGSVIRIDKVGSRFSGLYYVTSTTHRFSAKDGYTTGFKVRRNAA